MPYVPVPKDLTKVKNKVVFGLTKRQLICFSLAAVVGLPVYFLTKGAIGNTLATFLMIVVMAPFFFIAMYERDGQTAEQILKNWIHHKMRPKERPYKTQNLYRILSERKEGDMVVKGKTTGQKSGENNKTRYNKTKENKSEC